MKIKCSPGGGGVIEISTFFFFKKCGNGKRMQGVYENIQMNRDVESLMHKTLLHKGDGLLRVRLGVGG